jgi:NAD(P)-dependent dehydrogenase (short-subunit alcohol dehydrogenase family)
MSQRFVEKVVVVLGGNSGIGLASAKAFAREGARVVITGRNLDTLATAAREVGSGTVVFRSDMSDLQQISSVFGKIDERFGRVDVLFVNAGVGVLLPVEAVTENNWDWVLNTNLKGVFFSVQRALPLMSRGAAIVLTGSIAGRKAAPTGSVYTASKAGLRALGRSFAAEFVKRGIRVNVVSPGPIETPLLDRIEGISLEAVPALKNDMIESNPMQRMGLPEEVAEAVLFLASDAAAYITGIDFLVDGGAASF